MPSDRVLEVVSINIVLSSWYIPIFLNIIKFASSLTLMEY